FSDCTLHLPPRTTLFPYTTLFRSRRREFAAEAADLHGSFGYLPGLGDSGYVGIREAAGLYGDGAANREGLGRERRCISRRDGAQDRKSTRLNSSHEWISYAVFCLK